MGQSPVCSFCSEKEREENLIPAGRNNFFISENIKNHSETLMDRPILKKTEKEENPLRLSYVGAYNTTIRDGFGIIKWSNSSIFKGIFHNGIPSGWGTYSNPSSGTYEGEYDQDQPNGYGIYKHINDSFYEGDWVNERQEGIGIEKWKDGAVYKGEFVKGKKSGVGKYVFPNNNMYFGEWDQNVMNGFGIYCYGNNHFYCGEWVNGVRDGYGEVYSSNNDRFFGFFRNNLQNGFFMFYNVKSGKIIIGYNTNGKIDGIVKYFKPKCTPKLLIAKNGKKIDEIVGEEKILKYLNDTSNFDPSQPFMKDKTYNKYFLKSKEELEHELIQKSYAGEEDLCNILEE